MQIEARIKQSGDHYDTRVYQTMHNIGYNPLGLVRALTYWSAKAIRTAYLKAPGPLVQA